MSRTYFHPIKEDAIVSISHFLRQEAEREGLGALPHVDALLRARCVEPETLQTPRNNSPRDRCRAALTACVVGAQP